MTDTESGWDFLMRVDKWAAAMGAAIAVLGAVLTRGWQFPLPVALGTVFDVGSLRWVVARERGMSRDSAAGVRLAMAWVAVRLLIKVVLLSVTAAFASKTSIWGMLVGLLVVDITILIRGTAVAATRMRR